MRVYINNMRPAWTIERQEATLDAMLPGWRTGSIYRDVLSPRKRMRHNPADLAQRTLALRPTQRASGEVLHVVALSLLDWTQAGFLDVLAALRKRGTTLVALDCGTRIDGDSDWAAATRAFLAAVGSPGKNGGQVSGERRSLVAKAACEAMRERWGRRDDRTTDLLHEYGVSRPTAIQYLGKRADAQLAHDRAVAAAARIKARAERAKKGAEANG